MLSTYIESFSNKKFDWGSVDCYQFVKGWFAIKHPDLLLPIPEYFTTRSALTAIAQFYSIDNYLQDKVKYRIIKDTKAFIDGDVVITFEGSLICMHLACDGHLWSISKDRGLTKIDKEILPVALDDLSTLTVRIY